MEQCPWLTSVSDLREILSTANELSGCAFVSECRRYEFPVSSVCLSMIDSLISEAVKRVIKKLCNLRYEVKQNIIPREIIFYEHVQYRSR